MLIYALTVVFNLIFSLNQTKPIPKIAIQNQQVQISQPTIDQTIDEATAPTYSLTPTETPAIIIRTPSNTEMILEQINNYRMGLGLSSLSTTNTICSFAQTRAVEITTDFSHKGFEDRVNSHTLPYTYHFVAENIAETSNPKQVFDLWRNSPGHDANMKSTAIFGCIGQSGNFYALELWTP